MGSLDSPAFFMFVSDLRQNASNLISVCYSRQFADRLCMKPVLVLYMYTGSICRRNRICMNWSHCIVCTVCTPLSLPSLSTVTPQYRVYDDSHPPMCWDSVLGLEVSRALGGGNTDAGRCLRRIDSPTPSQ